MTDSPIRSHVGAAVGFILLGLLFTWPLPLHLSTHLTGAPSGDTGVYVWNLWVFCHELMQGRLPFYTSSILTMGELQPVNLSLHNYTAFANVLALPFLPFFGILSTFNAIYIVNIALAGYAMYLHLRGLTVRVAESWLGGALFAVSPVLIARGTAHFSLVAAAPLPIFAMFMTRTLVHHRLRDAIFAGLTVAWAAFCDAYFAVYCVIIAAFTLVAHVLRVRRASGAPALQRITATRMVDVALVILGGFVIGMLFRGGREVMLFGIKISMRTLYTPMLVFSVLAVVRLMLTFRPRFSLQLDRLRPGLATLGVAGILATALPLAPVLYAFGERMLSHDQGHPPTYWRSSAPGVDLLAFFMPNPNHPWWGQFFTDYIIAWSGRADGFPEFTAAIPFTALGVIAFAWWRVGWRPGPVIIVFIGFFALLALGPFIHVAGYNTHIPTPWALLRYVPLVNLARTPARFSIVVMFGVGVFFALALNAIATRYPEWRRTVLAIVGVLLLFELTPIPRPLYSASIPAIYDIIERDPSPGVRVLELPFGVRDGASSMGDYSALSQYYQTKHKKALIGGYVSRVSPKRKAWYRNLPVLNALITLSEHRGLTPEERADALTSSDRFLSRARLGYVVVDVERTSPELLAFATELLGLTKIASDGPRELYVPRKVEGNVP